MGTGRAPLELLPFVRTAPWLFQLEFFGGGGVKSWGWSWEKNTERERYELGAEMLQAVFAMTWRPREVYRVIPAPSIFCPRLERADTPRVKVSPSYKLE